MRYILIFIITAISHSMVAMDPIATETPLTTALSRSAQLIQITDTAINAHCNTHTQKNPDNPPKSLKINDLSEKKMFKILAIVEQHNPTITIAFIKALKKKNDLFMKTIAYFCELASENLNGVTHSTLDTINNPLHLQPIKKLNKLVLPIKEYVMYVAYKDIQFLYNMIFEGHQNSVESVDTNKIAHLTASASEDGTFRLWDFDSGKELHIFEEKANCGYVRFNIDGLQLATATTCEHDPEKSRIMIWNTQSKKRLYKIETTGPINWIDFITLGNETTLIVAKPFSLSYYTLKKGTRPLFSHSRNNAVKTDKIMPAHGTVDGEHHYWYVTKNSRPLALCNHALNNTTNEEDIVTIKLTSTYKNLSQYEKQIFKTKFKQKLQEYTK